MLVFEKDLYPAFTSGESEKIVKALESVIDLAKQSIVDADTVFRTMNWSWPLLTAKARGTSADGIAILERFTRLIEALLKTCSPSLVPSISGCKIVLRAIIRGIGAISPVTALAYLEAIETHVLSHKGARGFFLDKAAVEQLLALSDSTSDAELGEKTDLLLEKILRTKRLFSVEVLIEFLVKLIKAKECSAEVAKLVSSVLVAHKSRLLYNSLMDKLGFIRLSTEESVLRKLTIINFYIQLIRSDCPGEHIPAAISKSEMTSSILNWKSNKLVAAFVLRLCGTVLERFVDSFESPSVRDRLVDINSIIPVLKTILAEEESPANLIILQQLVRMIVEFKRTFPGSFLECKFDWLKLLDSKISDSYMRTLVRLVAALNMYSTPITATVGRAWVRLITVACDAHSSSFLKDDCFEAMAEWFKVGSGKSLVSGTQEGQRFIKLIRKYTTSIDVAELVSRIFAALVECPKDFLSAMRESDTQSVLQLVLKSERVRAILGEKDIVRKLKRKREEEIAEESETQHSSPKNADHSHQEEPVLKLPRVSLRNRWKCAPLPEDADLEDPYDMVAANWSTLLFANEIDAVDEPAINLIQLVGSNKLYHTIVSLSSDNDCVRSSAYEVLSVVLRALAMSIEAKGLESTRFAFREAPQVAMILTWLRNGISAPGEGENVPGPLPLITTVFIVEALKIMFDPQHVLYTMVFKHILVKASMNTINDIQMWTSLFFGTDGENFAAARHWILEMIKIASCDSKSVDIMVRRGVIEAVVESTVNLNASSDEFHVGVEIIGRLLKNLPPDARCGFVRKYAMCQWALFAVNSKWLRFDD